MASGHGLATADLEESLPSTVMACRSCGRSEVDLVVDFGELPNADSFPPADSVTDDQVRPLQLWLCRRCAMVQLGPVGVDDEEPVLAVESDTSRQHARDSAAAILAEHPALVGGSVAEFASHHGGSWLPSLIESGCRLVDSGPAELVVDVHGVVHEPAPREAFGLRVDRLSDSGLLVIEFHHLLPLILETQFDTVRHGHWVYLSATALTAMAADFGLVPVSARPVPVFGGSLRMAFTRDPDRFPPDGSVADLIAQERAVGLDEPAAFRAFNAASLRSADALHRYLTDLHESGTTVAGYGAPSKAAVLLGMSGVTAELLPFTVDRATGKHGRRIPGCGIPIRSIDALRQARPDVVVVLTWDIAAEVIADLESNGGWGARYVLPLPEPHAVPSDRNPSS